ncbi:MAG: hypothetical protein K5745_07645 [Saccharofermentans sp.]|nr:hypothetical protein [Saccharofermentans sp.]
MMTRAQLRRFLLEGIGLLLLSVLVVLGGFFLSSGNHASRRQEEYIARFASVLTADRFEILNTSVLSDYPDINSVYMGYDDEGSPVGYVVDITTIPDGRALHMLVGIDYENSVITGIQYLNDVDNPYPITDLVIQSIKGRLEGERIPIAFVEEETDTVIDEEVIPSTQYVDGTYYAQEFEDDKLGYIDYVEIEIEGGVITRVQWDAFNMDPTTENRSAASLSGAYEVSGLDWATQSYNVCHALLEWQDPEKLAMKSDGTTEIVDGVTCNISAFVQLSSECLENARYGFNKHNYYKGLDEILIKLFGSDAEELGYLNDNGFVVFSFKEYPEVYTIYGEANEDGEAEAIGYLNLRQIVNGNPGEDDDQEEPGEATPVPEIAPDTTHDGSEDGRINTGRESDQILTDSIDDLPMTEIATRITPVNNAYNETRQVVHVCNTCYKFLKDYLNWLV